MGRPSTLQRIGANRQPTQHTPLHCQELDDKQRRKTIHIHPPRRRLLPSTQTICRRTPKSGRFGLCLQHKKNFGRKDSFPGSQFVYLHRQKLGRIYDLGRERQHSDNTTQRSVFAISRNTHHAIRKRRSQRGCRTLQRRFQKKSCGNRSFQI